MATEKLSVSSIELSPEERMEFPGPAAVRAGDFRRTVTYQGGEWTILNALISETPEDVSVVYELTRDA